MILAPGTMLGSYRVGDVIGIGGMAVVYRAEHVGLGRPVALKVLSSRLGRDEQFRERFRREGKHVAALDHPNIVSVYDSGEADGQLYLAMRLVEGTTLAEQMDDRAVMAADVIGLLRPIAEALDAAHAADLVHRDVKPQNILIGPGNHPYLADFGVAKGGRTGGLTATGGFVGSFNYAAPEQFMNRGVSSATDVYSLCAVLFQCLTGQVPYPRDTDAGLLSAHVTEPPPTVSVSEPADEALNAVLARGMAKEPAIRYDRASDLIAEAAAALGTLSGERLGAAPLFAPSEGTRAREWAGLADSLAADPPDVHTITPDHEPIAQPPPAVDTEIVVAASEDVSPPAGEYESAHAKPAADTGGLNRVSRPDTEIVEGIAATPMAGGDHTAADRLSARPAPMPAVSEPRRRTGVIVGAAAVTVALVAGGIAVTMTGGGARAVPLQTVDAGPLSLRYRAPWRTAPAPTALTGVIAKPAVLADRAATLVAGPVVRSAAIPGALPPALRTRLGHPSATTAITLAGHRAQRYAWRSDSSGPIIAIVLPTTGRDLAVICSAATTTAASACVPVIATATVRGTSVLAPGPDTALGATLRAALDPVAAVRARRGLAGPLSARAVTAFKIARTEQPAAARVAAAEVPARYRALTADLTTALRAEATGFGALATAARSGHRSAYASAASTIQRAGVRLAAARAAAAAAGLPVPEFAPISVPRAPAPKKAKPKATSSASSGTPVQNTVPSQVTTTPVTGTPVTRQPVVRQPTVSSTPPTPHKTTSSSNSNTNPSASGQQSGTG